MEKTKSNGKELTTQDWNRELAAQYEIEVDRAPEVGDRWLKARNKVFDLDDITATELRIITLDWVHENVFYPGAYTPGTTSAPTCWALNENGRELAPSDDTPDKQSDSCSNCWANEFKSAHNGRQGKACRNNIRLAILILQQDGADGIQAFLRIPPSSIKPFSSFVDKVQRMAKLPLRGVSVRLTFDQIPTYTRFVFGEIQKVENPQLIEVIRSYPYGRDSELRRKLLRGFRSEVEAAARANAEDQAQVDAMLSDG